MINNLPDKKYNIIYADPPWEYRQSGSKTSSRGMAKQFYKTMNIEEIKALPVDKIADDECWLFLWCTYPQLPEGISILKAWGFRYINCAFTWIKRTVNDKDHVGMGYYTRANPELVLLGMKGKPKPQSHSVRNIVYSQIGPHSKKPDIIRNHIVELAGDLPRIELFARQELVGWDHWGDEVDT